MSVLDDLNDRIPDWLRWTYIALVGIAMVVATVTILSGHTDVLFRMADAFPYWNWIAGS